MRLPYVIVGLAIVTVLVVANAYSKTEPEPSAAMFDQIMGLIILVAALGGASALAGYVLNRYLGWNSVIAASVVYLIFLFVASAVRY